MCRCKSKLLLIHIEYSTLRRPQFVQLRAAKVIFANHFHLLEHTAYQGDRLCMRELRQLNFRLTGSKKQSVWRATIPYRPLNSRMVSKVTSCSSTGVQGRESRSLYGRKKAIEKLPARIANIIVMPLAKSCRS